MIFFSYIYKCLRIFQVNSKNIKKDFKKKVRGRYEDMPNCNYMYFQLKYKVFLI